MKHYLLISMFCLITGAGGLWGFDIVIKKALAGEYNLETNPTFTVRELTKDASGPTILHAIAREISGGKISEKGKSNLLEYAKKIFSVIEPQKPLGVTSLTVINSTDMLKKADENGKLPLDLAIEANSKELTELFVKNGAVVDVNVIKLASKGVIFENKDAIYDALWAAKNFDYTTKDVEGNTFLHIVVGDTELSKKFLADLMKIDEIRKLLTVKNNAGKTPVEVEDPTTKPLSTYLTKIENELMNDFAGSLSQVV